MLPKSRASLQKQKNSKGCQAQQGDNPVLWGEAVAFSEAPVLSSEPPRLHRHSQIVGQDEGLKQQRHEQREQVLHVAELESQIDPARSLRLGYVPDLEADERHIAHTGSDHKGKGVRQTEQPQCIPDLGGAGSPEHQDRDREQHKKPQRELQGGIHVVENQADDENEGRERQGHAQGFNEPFQLSAEGRHNEQEHACADQGCGMNRHEHRRDGRYADDEPGAGIKVAHRRLRCHCGRRARADLPPGPLPRPGHPP